jgi:uracil phosphoribosyltransferase
VLDFPCTTVLNYFDAQNGFISASRYHPNNDDSFEIIVEYQAIADFNEIFITSRSNACNRTINHSGLKNERGVAKEIHIAVVIAAPEE